MTEGEKAGAASGPHEMRRYEDKEKDQIQRHWILACARMTEEEKARMTEEEKAGMTEGEKAGPASVAAPSHGASSGPPDNPLPWRERAG